MRIPTLAEFRALDDAESASQLLGFGLLPTGICGEVVDYLEAAGVTDDDFPDEIDDDAILSRDDQVDWMDEEVFAEFLREFAPAVATKLGLDGA